MTDDSVCVYSDSNIEFNLEPIENGLSATFFNLNTNTVVDYLELMFNVGVTSSTQGWIDDMISFLIGQFDMHVHS
jgi:hypothetical protein